MNLITLPQGQLITKPGVYDLTMDAYHGQPCDGPSISSGGLRTIWNKSPAHFWHESRMNPANWEDRPIEEGSVETERVFIHDGDRPHFALGRAAHHLLFLGRKGFDAEYAVRPEKWKDWRTDAAKSWRAEQIKAGLTIITDAELADIAGMARSLAENPLVKRGLLDGQVERSLIWKDELTGIWLKSRPDNLTTSGSDASDLKTTTAVDDETIERTLGGLGYHVQGDLVRRGMKAVLGVDMTSFALVFVEKTAPWCNRVIEIHPEDLVRGSMQIDVAAAEFANCVATGVWPGPGGYAKDAEYMPLPVWARKRIDAQLERAKADAHSPFATAAE